MKTLLIALFGSLLVTTVAVAAPPAARQVRQAARIEQGVKSGQLTKVETAKVAATQARIARSKRRAKADGVVTRKEAARLDRQQDHASRQIKRLKHNGRTR